MPESAPTPRRTNTNDATCHECGGTVPAGTGIVWWEAGPDDGGDVLGRTPAGWRVSHQDEAQCAAQRAARRAAQEAARAQRLAAAQAQRTAAAERNAQARQTVPPPAERLTLRGLPVRITNPHEYRAYHQYHLDLAALSELPEYASRLVYRTWGERQQYGGWYLRPEAGTSAEIRLWTTPDGEPHGDTDLLGPLTPDEAASLLDDRHRRQVHATTP